MNLLERLLNASGKKKEQQSDSVKEAVKAKLKSLVYDDEIVEELLPTFLTLQGVEGFGKVLELLESKEQQIEAISGGDWFNKTTEDEVKTHSTKEDEEQESTNLVEQILEQKYGES